MSHLCDHHPLLYSKCKQVNISQCMMWGLWKGRKKNHMLLYCCMHHVSADYFPIAHNNMLKKLSHSTNTFICNLTVILNWLAKCTETLYSSVFMSVIGLIAITFTVFLRLICIYVLKFNTEDSSWPLSLHNKYGKYDPFGQYTVHTASFLIACFHFLKPNNPATNMVNV